MFLTEDAILSDVVQKDSEWEQLSQVKKGGRFQSFDETTQEQRHNDISECAF
jgi:hypothetical protein